ncbi:MAG: integrase [Myxococcaceae bacterium]|nr:MAG: integrase [Myxococcaceae bacterium]
MLDQFFRRRRVRRRIQRNLLAEALTALADHLGRRGHPEVVLQSYMQAAEHFGYWLRRKGFAAADVNAGTVRTFLVRHLPHCHCPPPHPRAIPLVRAALHQLVLVVHARDPAPQELSLTPLDAITGGFDAHLRTTCGLAVATRRAYGHHVRELLVARYGAGPIDLAALTLADVTAFVAARGARLAPASANAITLAVRSFLRYLRLQGIGDARWVAAVPRAAQWSLATLPRVLTDAELSAFLAAFDRATATGRRGYALALCFTELAMRVGEVARLALEDIDWRAGVLTLAPGKTRRASQLPLPASVAAALADYLQHGRPTTTSRVIFVHHRAPRGQPLGPSGMREDVRRAYRRAGLDARLTGTHVLRHTAATRMLRAGVSLKEIADVLGHRSLDTSAIYAKVDRSALTEVALPWPEGQP